MLINAFPSARFSPDREYRYLLARDIGFAGTRACMFVMLNPSTADEHKGDPTIRRCIARDHGWWDTERTFGDCIALVHSELSEALEAYRVHGLEDQTYEANDWESMRPDDQRR